MVKWLSLEKLNVVDALVEDFPGIPDIWGNQNPSGHWLYMQMWTKDMTSGKILEVV